MRLLFFMFLSNIALAQHANTGGGGRPAATAMAPVYSWLRCNGAGNVEIWLTYDPHFDEQQRPVTRPSFRVDATGRLALDERFEQAYSLATWPVGTFTGNNGNRRGSLRVASCPSPEPADDGGRTGGCTGTWTHGGTTIDVVCRYRLAPLR